MNTPFAVYAIVLNETNIQQIDTVARPLGWTLDHLKDNMEFNAEDGFDTILYMKLFPDSTEIATFDDQSLVGLDATFRLTDELDPKFGIFHKIEKF